MYNVFFCNFVEMDHLRSFLVICDLIKPSVRPEIEKHSPHSYITVLGTGRTVMLNFTMCAKRVSDIFLRHNTRRHREIIIGTVIRGGNNDSLTLCFNGKKHALQFVSRFNIFANLSPAKSRVLNIRPCV